MAKIIFSTASGIVNKSKTPCFYEGFIRALARNGNQVMLMIANDFLENPWSSGSIKRNLDVKKLEEDIIDFNPDLVIAANNVIYDRIPTILECPVIIYGVDSPSLFTDKNFIKKNPSRYDLLVASRDFIKISKEYFGDNLKSVNVMNFATDFVAEEKIQNKNISFIGTDFSFSVNRLNKLIKDDDKKKEIIKNLYARFIWGKSY